MRVSWKNAGHLQTRTPPCVGHIIAGAMENEGWKQTFRQWIAEYQKVAGDSKESIEERVEAFKEEQELEKRASISRARVRCSFSYSNSYGEFRSENCRPPDERPSRAVAQSRQL